MEDKELEKRVAEVVREGALKGGLEGRVVALLRTVRDETIEACAVIADVFPNGLNGENYIAQVIRNQRSRE